MYSANITSDPETGIGVWTDAEIKGAIKEGISRDGTKLLVMPWEFLQGLADEDLDNIIAYLQSIPAVSRVPGDLNPAFPGLPPPSGPPSALPAMGTA